MASLRADGQPGGPRPRQLIITIYGLYARDEPNWLSIASLVRLMADLGVEGQAVRSSVARLKRRGLLISVHRSGTAGYALSPTSLEVLREGDARIFGQHRATVQEGWVLVVFSVPESERDQRHKLRSWLSRLGFGTVAPGVWVAPGRLADEVSGVLARRNLSGYVDIFRADHLDPGLPLELLPAHWNGTTAGNIFAVINDHLGGQARRHAESVILGA
jgi:phenylacetic acid degradation operon negative regulatory protein